MFWSLCVECVEFLSQRRSGDVLMESRHLQVRNTHTRFRHASLQLYHYMLYAYLSNRESAPVSVCLRFPVSSKPEDHFKQSKNRLERVCVRVDAGGGWGGEEHQCIYMYVQCVCMLSLIHI